MDKEEIASPQHHQHQHLRQVGQLALMSLEQESWPDFLLQHSKEQAL